MQGLSDGYFVIPYTIGDYLAKSGAGAISPDSPEVKEVMESVRQRVDQLTSVKGKRSSRSYHKELGQIMWEYAGMARNASGLEKAIGQIQDLRDDFNKNLLVPGSGDNLNAELKELVGSVISLILANCYVEMHLKEMSLVVVIFEKSIKLMMAKHLEMTKISLTPQFGNIRVMRSSPPDIVRI